MLIFTETEVMHTRLSQYGVSVLTHTATINQCRHNAAAALVQGKNISTISPVKYTAATRSIHVPFSGDRERDEGRGSS